MFGSANSPKQDGDFRFVPIVGGFAPCRTFSRSFPEYRKHKASGRAIAALAGRDCYLGPDGTKTSRAEYDRLVDEWLASGRRPPLIRRKTLAIGL